MLIASCAVVDRRVTGCRDKRTILCIGRENPAADLKVSKKMALRFRPFKTALSSLDRYLYIHKYRDCDRNNNKKHAWYITMFTCTRHLHEKRLLNLRAGQ